MDHAPFHHSQRMRQLMENPGCELWYLPNYSRLFYPIEPWWQKIKTAIRKELPTYNFHVPQAADAAFQTW
ncbi:MAG: hypothetical protein BRC41_01080 [Cyanobacteria bacterium QH_9_48_43]|nr:MAG: hypothetical protein BRC41_01080 [Cyanobacteria bacterium QH_9_48_43]